MIGAAEKVWFSMKKTLAFILVALLICAFALPASAAPTEINMGDLIANQAGWEGTMNEPFAAGQTIWEANSFTFKPGQIKSAGYKAGNWDNEFVLDYKLKVTWPEDAGDWGCILTFFDQEPGLNVWEGTKTSCYGVYYSLDADNEDMTTNGAVSITRWNNGDGDTGPENLGKEAEFSGFELSGKEMVYRLSVQRVAGGVRMRLYIDGKCVIDFTDTSAKQVTHGGTFTFINHGPRSVVASGVSASEMPSSFIEKNQGTTTNPTEPSVEPTTEPTVEPTTEPTTEPTVEPTSEPTAEPTVAPTQAPTQPVTTPVQGGNQDNASADQTGLVIGIVAAVVVIVLVGGGVAAAVIIKKKKN